MATLRIATYNIHKGVRGLGPLQRLEIHNLRQAVAQLGADIVCPQEVRAFHHRLARLGLRTLQGGRVPTFPARLPLLALDRIYVRGLRLLALQAPHGRPWTRLSDHLPLVGEVAWA